MFNERPEPCKSSRKGKPFDAKRKQLEVLAQMEQSETGAATMQPNSWKVEDYK
jgi:hypothetical protein